MTIASEIERVEEEIDEINEVINEREGNLDADLLNEMCKIDIKLETLKFAQSEIQKLESQIDILDTDNECLIANNAMLEYQLSEMEAELKKQKDREIEVLRNFLYYDSNIEHLKERLEELTTHSQKIYGGDELNSSPPKVDICSSDKQEKSSRASIDVANEVSELSSHSPVKTQGCGRMLGLLDEDDEEVCCGDSHGFWLCKECQKNSEVKE